MFNQKVILYANGTFLFNFLPNSLIPRLSLIKAMSKSGACGCSFTYFSCNMSFSESISTKPFVCDLDDAPNLALTLEN